MPEIEVQVLPPVPDPRSGDAALPGPGIDHRLVDGPVYGEQPDEDSCAHGKEGRNDHQLNQPRDDIQRLDGPYRLDPLREKQGCQESDHAACPENYGPPVKEALGADRPGGAAVQPSQGDGRDQTGGEQEGRHLKPHRQPYPGCRAQGRGEGSLAGPPDQHREAEDHIWVHIPRRLGSGRGVTGGDQRLTTSGGPGLRGRPPGTVAGAGLVVGPGRCPSPPGARCDRVPGGDAGTEPVGGTCTRRRWR